MAGLLQVGIYGGLAAWLGPRWDLAAGLAGFMAVVQLVGAVGGLVRGSPRLTRWTANISLVGSAVLLGMYVQAAVHVATRFGAEATAHGHTSLLVIFALAPWVVGIPLWQRSASTPASSRSPTPLPVVLIAALALPVGTRAWADRPVERWAEQPALLEAAEATFATWNGERQELPSGSGPAVVLLTPWRDGRAGETVRGEGDDLSAALSQALPRLAPATGERRALVIDVARTRWSTLGGRMGELGGLGPTSNRSPSVVWRPGETRNRRVAPQWWVPVPVLGRGQHPTSFDSVIVDADGATPLSMGWAAAPDLDADAALEAAVGGGDMILRNMSEDDRYAYVMKGPSGRKGSGYNLPRHAGVTWYLARLALRTDEARFHEGASRGLAYMEGLTTDMGDGRAYVSDKRRKDGKIWVGTTSLAVMGAAILDHPLAASWGAFLASSVDEEGAVRGEMDLASGTFPAQQLNPYGQGQTVLALAILVREGHEELRPALERAARYMDGGYAPGGAARLVVLDEHWTCIASQVVDEALGTPYGEGACRGYLAEQKPRTPSSTSSLRASSGAAGGLAEAVVAAAHTLGDAKYVDRSAAFGQQFLDSTYRPADAPFLGRPATLMGGFRDSPIKLDVRMDAVQHIGCALLGIEALLRGQAQPGNHP